jgi:thioredoxin-like negative regulator of GroEL
MDRFLRDVGAENLPLNTDPASRLSGAMGVLGLPVTVLINADGQEIARVQGAADWASPEALALLRHLSGT